MLSGFTQPGNIFFNNPQVHQINILFYEPNYYDSLVYYKEQANQTGIEKYIHADVVINNDTVYNVGIRFRGNSSYNHPGSKKPIQLDFNEFVSGQKYDEMKKLNLNNSYLDPTQMREKLLMDILRANGMAAPRITYTTLKFNGNPIGLYKAVEPINKQFLEAYFGNDDGNLYKCEPMCELSWEGNNQSSYYDNAELKTNETLNDWSDFVDLIYTINYSGNNFENNIRTKFGLDEYIKSWAVNMVFGNLDAYFYLPHNYYLYHNSTNNKFEWITWDVSLAFGVYAFLVVPNSIKFDLQFLPDNAKNTRPLNYYILNDESLKAQYMNEICAFTKNDFLPHKLFPRIDSLANVIRPYVQNEPSQNQMFTFQEHQDNIEYTTINFQLIGQIPGLKDFIQQRRISITKQLCDYNWSCTQGQEIDPDEIMKVYPNPGKNIKVEMISPNEFYPTQYSLFNMNGKKIYSIEKNNLNGIMELPTDKLAAGTYIFKMSSGCKNQSVKIVITK